MKAYARKKFKDLPNQEKAEWLRKEEDDVIRFNREWMQIRNKPAEWMQIRNKPAETPPRSTSPKEQAHHHDKRLGRYDILWERAQDIARPVDPVEKAVMQRLANCMKRSFESRERIKLLKIKTTTKSAAATAHKAHNPSAGTIIDSAAATTTSQPAGILDFQGKDSTSEPAKKRGKRSMAWDEHFKELAVYEQVHGHCMVPTQNPGIGRWVGHQRCHYNLLKNGKKSPLTPSKLQSLGFCWDAVQQKQLLQVQQKQKQLLQVQQKQMNLLQQKGMQLLQQQIGRKV